MAKPQTSAILAAVTWALLALVVVLGVVRTTGHPLADYDFGTGQVRCGVAGLSTSCGSSAP